MRKSVEHAFPVLVLLSSVLWVQVVSGGDRPAGRAASSVSLSVSAGSARIVVFRPETEGYPPVPDFEVQDADSGVSSPVLKGRMVTWEVPIGGCRVQVRNARYSFMGIKASYRPTVFAKILQEGDILYLQPAVEIAFSGPPLLVLRESTAEAYDAAGPPAPLDFAERLRYLRAIEDEKRDLWYVSVGMLPIGSSADQRLALSFVPLMISVGYFFREPGIGVGIEGLTNFGSGETLLGVQGFIAGFWGELGLGLYARLIPPSEDFLQSHSLEALNWPLFPAASCGVRIPLFIEDLVKLDLHMRILYMPTTRFAQPRDSLVTFLYDITGLSLFQHFRGEAGIRFYF